MVSLLAGKPPAMPYWESPTVQALIALSMLYVSFPGETLLSGEFGLAYSGSCSSVGPVAFQAPYMSYVIASPKVRYWPIWLVWILSILSWPEGSAADR